MRDKNLFFCSRKKCEEILDLRKSHKGHVMCTRCQVEFCAKCKREKHDKLSCAEAEQKDGLIVNDMQVHNCPKCGAMFELVEGCADVQCSQCKYEFCWVCGSDNNSCFHNFMKIGCQVINLTFKFNIR